MKKLLQTIGATCGLPHAGIIFIKMLLPLSIALLSVTKLSAQQTLYSFTGHVPPPGKIWNNAFTWTTDETGAISAGERVPANGDNVVILPGVTVTLDVDVATTNLSIEIMAGGTLVIAARRFQNSIVNLTGSGTLIIEHSYYPHVSGAHSFAAAGGGTVIFRNFTGTLPSNLTNAANITLQTGANLNLGHTLNLHNDLSLENNARLSLGTAATPVNLQIGGNLNVAANTNLVVSNFNAFHNIRLSGNMHVEGVVDLSNSSQYAVAANGAAIFTFLGANHAQLTGSGGQLDFYRLIVDKGFDPTFILDVQRAFNLFGPIDLANTDSGDPNNPVIEKALWIRNGTLKLGANVNIPALSSGGSDFFIPRNAKLWVDGATVHSLLSTSGITSNAGITVIGTLRVSGGELRTNNSAGIVYKGGTALIQIEGGTVTMSQFRPSVVPGTHQAAWMQSGGTVTVNGTGENQNNHARFALPLATHSFEMTGGTLNLSTPDNVDNTMGLVIGAAPGNFNVTGGTVNITIGNNRNFDITTRAPLFNLNVSKTGATARDLRIAAITNPLGNNPAYPLVIGGNLTLNANARFYADRNNVTVMGNFTIASTASYLPDGNTTILQGRPAQTQTLTIDNNTTQFSNIEFIGPGATWVFAGTLSPVVVTGNLQQTGAGSTLNLSGKNLSVTGNVILENNPQNPLRWLNSPRLTITGGSSGVDSRLRVAGWHGNGPARLVLNITSREVVMMEDTDLHGTILELQEGVLFIGSNMLSTNSPVQGTGFANDRRIRTNGLVGDGGLRLRLRGISGTGVEYTFPVGSAWKYTPLRLTINGTFTIPDNDDHNHYIRVIPVNSPHPFTVDPNDVVRYYWLTEATPGVNISAFNNLNLTYRFTFDSGDAPSGGGGDRRAFFLLPTGLWGEDSDGYSGTNLTFDNVLPANRSTEFTGGRNHAFNHGPATIFLYSRNAAPNITGVGAAFHLAATWSTTGHHGSSGTAAPNANTILVIAPGHRVNITTANRRAKAVRLNSVGESRAILDLGFQTDVRIGQLTGGGILRLATAALPGRLSDGTRDFQNLAIFQPIDGGIIEYFGTTGISLLPFLTEYHNVWFTGTGIKTLPASVNFHGDVVLREGARVQTRSLAGTVNFNGQLIFHETTIPAAGENTFIFSPDEASTVNINGPLVLRGSGTIRVASSTATRLHNLHLRGQVMAAAGRVDLWGGAGNNNRANLWLQGPHDMNLGGTTGGTWVFNRLIIDKEQPENQVVVARTINLNAPTNGDEKALEVRRGTLSLQGNNNNAITLSSGGANFALPAGATVIAEGNNRLITSGSTGITLYGRLVFRGNARGQFSGTANTILYGAAGTAIFEAHDNAIVEVSGQFIQQLTGELNYIQTGNSQVVIGTQPPAVAGKPVMEILSGGNFTLAAPARLTIANGQGASIPALRLEPNTFQVSGTVVFGHTTTATGQQMGIMASIPLSHLHIDGSNNPVAYIHAHDLSLAHPVTALNIFTGTFRTNGRRLTLAGSIINRGAISGATGDQVTFSEGFQLQTISGNGTSTFHNLSFESSNGVDLQKNITVAGTLNIAQGFLNDRGFTIWCGGNINLLGNHLSPAATGGLALNGTVNQYIGGNGSVGRVTINKATGQARATSNITLTHTLRLENGVFNMHNHLLTLNENAIIEPVGPGFSVDKMILTSGGEIGNQGIRKVFSAADQAGEFIFPIGVAGKYTPLHITNLSVPAGRSITVYPVNQVHPNIAAQGTPSQVLQYYWVVNTDLGTQTMSADMAFRYSATDVRGTLGDYFTAHLRNLLNPPVWSKLDGFIPPPLIDENFIRFQPRNSNETLIDGDYTAGVSTAIPDIVSVFVTRPHQTGIWHDPNTWEGGVVPTEGSVTRVVHSSVVTINQDRVRVYQTQIFGHLRINPNTTFHNLGIITGNGVFEVEGTGDGVAINLPGRFSDFAATFGSTIIYSGQGGALPSGIPTYNNMIVRGSGIKLLPNIPLTTIAGNLDIQAATLRLHDNTIVELRGDIVLLDGAALRAHEHLNNRINLRGNRRQVITGDFSGANRFNNLDVNNINGVTLNNNTTVGRYLYLTNGVVHVAPTQTLSLTYPGVHRFWTNIQNRSSYIGGRLLRTVDLVPNPPYNTPERNLFPVGKGNLRRFVDIKTLNQPGASNNWIVEYFPENPRAIVPFTDSSLNPGVLESVSQYEYWVVQPPGEGLNLDLAFQYCAFSNLSHHLPDFNRTITLARAQDPRWYSMFNGTEAVVGPNAIRFNGVQFPATQSSAVTITFGAKTLESYPLPIELLSFSGSVTEGRSRLEWVTASETNNDFFTLERSVDGRTWQVIGIINSKAQNGFSTHPIHYLFFDENPLPGINYYRLKQTDFDGSYSYSPIIALRNKTRSEVLFLLYPNPTNGKSFTVSATGFLPEERITLSITGLNGRTIWVEYLEATPEGSIHTTLQPGFALPQGVYIVSLASSSTRNVVRMIVK